MSDDYEARLNDMDLVRYLDRQLGIEVSVNLARYWRTAGRGPSFTRVGRHIYYSKRDIDAWAQTDYAQQFRPRTVSIA